MVKISISTVLCLLGELAWGGSMAVALGLSDMWQVTGDTRHRTRDEWYVTHDTWHVTPDMWSLITKKQKNIEENKGRKGTNRGLFRHLKTVKKIEDCQDSQSVSQSVKVVRKLWESYENGVRMVWERCEKVVKKLWKSYAKGVRKL